MDLTAPVVGIDNNNINTSYICSDYYLERSVKNMIQNNKYNESTNTRAMLHDQFVFMKHYIDECGEIPEIPVQNYINNNGRYGGACLIGINGAAGTGKSFCTGSMFSSVGSMTLTGPEQNTSNALIDSVGKIYGAARVNSMTKTHTLFKLLGLQYSAPNMARLYHDIAADSNLQCAARAVYKATHDKLLIDNEQRVEKMMELEKMLYTKCRPFLKNIAIAIRNSYLESNIRFRLHRPYVGRKYYQGPDETFDYVTTSMEILLDDKLYAGDKVATKKRNYNGYKKPGNAHIPSNIAQKEELIQLAPDMYRHMKAVVTRQVQAELGQTGSQIISHSTIGIINCRLNKYRKILLLRDKIVDVMFDTYEICNMDQYAGYCMRAQQCLIFDEDAATKKPIEQKCVTIPPLLLKWVILSEEDGRTPYYMEFLWRQIVTIFAMVYNPPWIHENPMIYISSGSTTQTKCDKNNPSVLEMILAPEVNVDSGQVLCFTSSQFRRAKEPPTAIGAEMMRAMALPLELSRSFNEYLVHIMSLKGVDNTFVMDPGYFPTHNRLYRTHKAIIAFNERACARGVMNVVCENRCYIDSNIVINELSTPLKDDDKINIKNMIVHMKELDGEQQRPYLRPKTTRAAWKAIAGFFVKKHKLYSQYNGYKSTLYSKGPETMENIDYMLGDATATAAESVNINPFNFCPVREAKVDNVMRALTADIQDQKGKLAAQVLTYSADTHNLILDGSPPCKQIKLTTSDSGADADDDDDDNPVQLPSQRLTNHGRNTSKPDAARMFIMAPSWHVLTRKQHAEERRYEKAINSVLAESKPFTKVSNTDSRAKNKTADIERDELCDLTTVYATPDYALLDELHDLSKTDEEYPTMKEKIMDKFVESVASNCSNIQTHLCYKSKEYLKINGLLWYTAARAKNTGNTLVCGITGTLVQIRKSSALHAQRDIFKLGCFEQLITKIIIDILIRVCELNIQSPQQPNINNFEIPTTTTTTSADADDTNNHNHHTHSWEQVYQTMQRVKKQISKETKTSFHILEKTLFSIIDHGDMAADDNDDDTTTVVSREILSIARSFYDTMTKCDDQLCQIVLYRNEMAVYTKIKQKQQHTVPTGGCDLMPNKPEDLDVDKLIFKAYQYSTKVLDRLRTIIEKNKSVLEKFNIGPDTVYKDIYVYNSFFSRHTELNELKIPGQNFDVVSSKTNKCILLGARDHIALLPEQLVIDHSQHITHTLGTGLEASVIKKGYENAEFYDKQFIGDAFKTYFPQAHINNIVIVKIADVLVAKIYSMVSTTERWQTICASEQKQQQNAVVKYKAHGYAVGALLRKHLVFAEATNESLFHGLFRMHTQELTGRPHNIADHFPSEGISGWFIKSLKGSITYQAKQYSDEELCRIKNHSKTSNIDVTTTAVESTFVRIITTPFVTNTVNTYNAAQGSTITSHCFLNGPDLANRNSRCTIDDLRSCLLVGITRADSSTKTHISNSEDIGLLLLNTDDSVAVEEKNADKQRDTVVASYISLGKRCNRFLHLR